MYMVQIVTVPLSAAMTCVSGRVLHAPWKMYDHVQNITGRRLASVELWTSMGQVGEEITRQHSWLTKQLIEQDVVQRMPAGSSFSGIERLVEAVSRRQELEKPELKVERFSLDNDELAAKTRGVWFS